MNDSGITREGLYQTVWSEPIRVVAKQFGLSDQGLAKLCRRLAIPLPKRGYWAKLRAGHRLPQPPLPPMDDEYAIQAALMRIWPNEVAARLHKAERVKLEAREAETHTADIVIDPELRSPHPLVKQALKVLTRKTGWTNEKGLRERPDEAAMVSVTETSVTRALILVDALFKVFERKGIQPSVEPATATTWLKMGSDAIPFSLRETVRRKKHEVTPQEQKAIDTYQRHLKLGVVGHYQHLPMYDYFPTGELTILIGKWPSKSWSDASTIKLEDKLDKIVAGTLDIYAEIAERARKTAARRALHRQLQEEHVSKQTRFETELKAFQELEESASRWKRAEALRQYTAAFEKHLKEADQLSPEQETWLRWARAKADWLDPCIPYCDVILDAPVPPDPGPIW